MCIHAWKLPCHHFHFSYSISFDVTALISDGCAECNLHEWSVSLVVVRGWTRCVLAPAASALFSVLWARKNRGSPVISDTAVCNRLSSEVHRGRVHIRKINVKQRPYMSHDIKSQGGRGKKIHARISEQSKYMRGWLNKVARRKERALNTHCSWKLRSNRQSEARLIKYESRFCYCIAYVYVGTVIRCKL